MTLNPAGQYADDRNLRARQRFWQYQWPPFDTVAWVLNLVQIPAGLRVLDAGCGNGEYLRGLRDRQARAVGCDLSAGMLRAASHPALLNADIAALPVRDGAVDVVLAIHMLYHVPNRETALRELRRVLASLASHHQDETTRPWDDVVGDVRQHVQAVIDDQGAFTTSGDLAAFICQ